MATPMAAVSEAGGTSPEITEQPYYSAPPPWRGEGLCQTLSSRRAVGRQSPTLPWEARPGRRGGLPPRQRGATRHCGRLQGRKQRWQQQRREQGTRGEEDVGGADDDNTETGATGGDQRGGSPRHRAAKRGRRGGGGCLLTMPLPIPNRGQARGVGKQTRPWRDGGHSFMAPQGCSCRMPGGNIWRNPHLDRAIM